MGLYIIEINDKYKQVVLLSADGELYCKDVAGLNPYTEPDLEQVRKEAYDKGFDSGRMLNTGKYEKGVNDAWEAARTIVKMSWEDKNKIFGKMILHSNIFLDYTADEAIEKIRQYEQYEQEEIHLGDEVTFLPNNAKGIVSECHVPDIYSDNDKYAVWCGGTMEYVLKQHLTKTGRTFPEIAEVLAKMKEGES